MTIGINIDPAHNEHRWRGIGAYTRGVVNSKEFAKISNAVFLCSYSQFDVLDADIREKTAHYKDLSYFNIRGEAIDEINSLIYGRFLDDLGINQHLSFDPFAKNIAVEKLREFDIEQISIFYDLIPKNLPSVYLASNQEAIYYERRLESLSKNVALVPVSEYTKEQLKLWLGDDIDVSRKVAYPGVSKITTGDHSVKTNEEYLLYIGGVDPRKNLPSLIGAMKRISQDFPELQLWAVSDNPRAIQSLAEDYGLSDTIRTFTAITEAQKNSIISGAKALVSPSLEEGFGMPIAEAINHGIPVFAVNNSAQAEIVQDKRFLIDEGSATSIARKLLSYLRSPNSFSSPAHNPKAVIDFEITAKVIREVLSDRKQLSRSSEKTSLEEVLEKIEKVGSEATNHAAEIGHCLEENYRSAKKTVSRLVLTTGLVLAGPVHGAYSLSRVNRAIIRSLIDSGESVSICVSPSESEHQVRKTLEQMGIDKDIEISPDPRLLFNKTIFYNDYPVDLAKFENNCVFLTNYAWEESMYPRNFVEELNSYAIGVATVSNHVSKILVDSGVTVPITNLGESTQTAEWVPKNSDRFEMRNEFYNFLHISSSLPRKGINELLSAFRDEFKEEEAVRLTLKVTPNQHHDTRKFVESDEVLRKKVTVIDSEITDDEIQQLYLESNCLVLPSKAEGFNLPAFEAASIGMPLIVTGWGGHMDFLPTQNCQTLGFTLQPARSHFEQFFSLWAEPNDADLKKALRKAYEKKNDWIDPAAFRAKHLRSGEHYAKTLRKFISDAAHEKVVQPVISLISSWNERCGIAEYASTHEKYGLAFNTIFAPATQGLIGKDDARVFRYFEKGGEIPDEKIVTEMIDSGTNSVLIEHSWGFFEQWSFINLLRRLNSEGIVSIVRIHSAADSSKALGDQSSFFFRELSKYASRIVVHSNKELEHLGNFASMSKVSVLPLLSQTKMADAPQKKVSLGKVGFFGFATEQKNIMSLVKAHQLFSDLHEGSELHLFASTHVSGVSAGVHEEIEKFVTLNPEIKVTLNKEFNSEMEIDEFIKSCDLLVFPYYETKEGASAAARAALAFTPNVVLSPASIFDEFRSFTFSSEDYSADSICKSFENFLNESTESFEMRVESWKKWKAQTSFDKGVSALHSIMIQSLRNF